MGAGNVGEIAQRLVAGGRDPTTPVAAVRNGTRPDQQTVRATLATIGDAGVRAPSAIVVGEVAALDLAWFESRPLFGRSVVVTRAASRRAAARRARGPRRRRGLELPTIAIEPIDFAVPDLSAYEWLVFTSVNGVDAFFDDGLWRAGLDARALGGLAGRRRSAPAPRPALLAAASTPTWCPSASSPSRCSRRSPRRTAGRARAARPRRAGARRAARRARAARGLRGRRAPRVPHGARRTRRRDARRASAPATSTRSRSRRRRPSTTSATCSARCPTPSRASCRSARSRRTTRARARSPRRRRGRPAHHRRRRRRAPLRFGVPRSDQSRHRGRQNESEATATIASRGVPRTAHAPPPAHARAAPARRRGARCRSTTSSRRCS